jgi:predicted RNA polymerase sigma factor
VPTEADLPDRLAAVLYLVVNEGYAASGDDLIRPTRAARRSGWAGCSRRCC